MFLASDRLGAWNVRGSVEIDDTFRGAGGKARPLMRASGRNVSSSRSVAEADAGTLRPPTARPGGEYVRAEVETMGRRARG